MLDADLKGELCLKAVLATAAKTKRIISFNLSQVLAIDHGVEPRRRRAIRKFTKSPS